MGKFTKTIHFTIFIKLFFINYPYLGAEDEENCCKNLCPCFYKSEKSKSDINNEEENSNKEEKSEKKKEEKPEENEEAKIGEYSYDCSNADYLSVYIYVGTDEAKFEIYLRNIGDKPWANDSTLKIDKSSDCTTDEIKLEPQKPNEERSYKIIVKDLKNYPAGDYKIIFLFWSGGKINGEKIVAIIKIKEKDDEKNEIEENIGKIKDFRHEYSLSEEDYPNEIILKILKENDFNYEEAFGALLKLH